LPPDVAALHFSTAFLTVINDLRRRRVLCRATPELHASPVPCGPRHHIEDQEINMRQQLRAGVIALALLSSISVATAQSGLTAQQQQSVQQGLANQPNDSAPAGYQGQVGAKTPDSMTPHQMPSNVSSEVPESRNLLFVKLPDRVLLIDPDTKTIAEILLATDTTGSVPGSKK
jgi:hypothetical protein